MKFGTIKRTKTPKFGILEPIYNWKLGFEGLTEFQLCRIAVVNKFNLNSVDRNKIIIEINKRHDNGEFLILGIDRIGRNKMVNTMFGKMPSRNLLLKCSNTNNDRDAANHLILNYQFVKESKPTQPILNAIYTQCKECGGTFEPNTEYLLRYVI